MKNDTISRQWLMECVEGGWIKFDTEKDKNKFIHLVRDTAPSAQPVQLRRKPGKWIPIINGIGGHECSSCHNYAPFFQSGDEWLTDYCPHCGADMGEKDD